MSDIDLFDEREAARRLGLSVATMRRRRLIRQPPRANRRQPDRSSQVPLLLLVQPDYIRADKGIKILFAVQDPEPKFDPDRPELLRFPGQGLKHIRRLEGRIEDCKAWKIIHDRADDLESAFRAFAGTDEQP